MLWEGEEDETLTSTMLEKAIQNLLFNMLLKNFIFRIAVGAFLHGKIMFLLDVIYYQIQITVPMVVCLSLSYRSPK